MCGRCFQVSWWAGLVLDSTCFRFYFHVGYLISRASFHGRTVRYRWNSSVGPANHVTDICIFIQINSIRIEGIAFNSFNKLRCGLVKKIIYVVDWCYLCKCVSGRVHTGVSLIVVRFLLCFVSVAFVSLPPFTTEPSVSNWSTRVCVLLHTDPGVRGCDRCSFVLERNISIYKWNDRVLWFNLSRLYFNESLLFLYRSVALLKF